MCKIDWYRCEKQAEPTQILEVSKSINVVFPELFISLMMECDAGVPIKTDFEYYDQFHECVLPQSIGGFLGFNDLEYNILSIYLDPPEFFPNGLIAFAETGCGDFICFDYRQGKDNPDPPIVYWNHEADIGKDVSFIAHNFEEFIGMLQEPED